MEHSLNGLRQLVKVSKNVPRDALNNLERVLNEVGHVDEKAVSEVFDTINSQYYFTFLDSVLNKREDLYLKLFTELITSGKSGFNFFKRASRIYSSRYLYFIWCTFTRYY